MRRISSLLLVLFSIFAAAPASADETVSVGGGQAVLLRPAAPILPSPPGSRITLAVGAAPGGVITRLKNNQLVRTRDAYKAHGLAVLVLDRGISLGAAIGYMGRIKRPVIVVGTSRAQGAAAGAHLRLPHRSVRRKEERRRHPRLAGQPAAHPGDPSPP